ncbi:DNA-3-methyladenine glycosylase family protein [Fluviispira vulneris]|uniref:DNA-3-methyladenine glycosylase family protein n=1 Tax=Fluviispira vulneris TaxID=2763012 RepID=UPI0016448FAD|nr:DNA-3-methyladenine glycosylase 2 family protein [Fluviispira vulneris]
MVKININKIEIDNFFQNISTYSVHSQSASFYEDALYLAYSDLSSDSAQIVKLTRENFNNILNEHSIIASLLGYDYVLPDKVSENIRKFALFKKIGLEKCPPIRLSGFEGLFEGLGQIVIGQQISVAAANTIRTNLIKCFGTKISFDNAVTLQTFPSASIFKSLKDHQLSDVGLSAMKRKCLKELSDFFLKNILDIKNVMLGHGDLVAFRKALKNIHGIGDWTLDWFELKIMRNFNCIPVSDFAVKKSFQWALGANDLATREEIEQYSIKVKPFSGILCHNLLYSYQKHMRSLKK